MSNRLPNEPCDCCGRESESHAVNCKHYIEMQRRQQGRATAAFDKLRGYHAIQLSTLGVAFAWKDLN